MAHISLSNEVGFFRLLLTLFRAARHLASLLLRGEVQHKPARMPLFSRSVTKDKHFWIANAMVSLSRHFYGLILVELILSRCGWRQGMAQLAIFELHSYSPRFTFGPSSTSDTPTM